MKLKPNGKFSSLGFTIGHWGLIAFFAVVVIGLGLAKEPMLLGNLTGLKFLQASDENTESGLDLTSDLPPISPEAIDKILSEKNNLSALIDPTFGEGSVLGLSTEAQESIDTILSDKNLATIPVNSVKADQFNTAIYFDQVSLVEDYFGSILVLSAIGSRDASVAKEAIPVTQRIIAELKAISVPNIYIRYHRLKLMQYGIVLNMLDNIAYNSSPKDKSAAGILFFEISNAAEAEKSKLILGQ